MIKFKEIKEKCQVNKRFSFQHVSEATVRKVVKSAPSDKAVKWCYFTHKDMLYSLRTGLTLGLPKNHSFYYSTNAVQFIFVVLSYAVIFLLL